MDRDFQTETRRPPPVASSTTKHVNGSFKRYLADRTPEETLETDIIRGFEDDATQHEGFRVEFEHEVAEVEGTNMVPFAGQVTARKMTYTPFEWQHAKRLAPPYMMGNSIAIWLRGLARYPSNQDQTNSRLSLKSLGLLPAQWWENGTYFYINDLQKEVSFSDLFFDLVYVTLISRAGERLSEGLTWLAMARYVVVFYIIWETWHFASNLNNSIYMHPTTQRLFSLVFVVFGVWLGAFTFNAFNVSEPGMDTTGAFISVFLFGGLVRVLVLALVALQVKDLRKAVLYRVAVILAVAIPWIIASSTHNAAFQLVLCWISTLLSTFVIWVFNGFNLVQSVITLTPDCGHWIERNHLFILISAGEGVSQAVVQVAGDEQFATALGMSAMEIMIMSILVFMYFCMEGQSSGLVVMHAVRRNPFLGTVWTVMHFWIVLALVAVANAFVILNAIAMDRHNPQEILEPQTVEQALTGGRYLLVGSVANFVITISLVELLHLTVFDMSPKVMQAQDRYLEAGTNQQFFWGPRYKWIRFLLHLVAALIICIGSIPALNLSAKSVTGLTLVMLVILAIVEEMYSGMFGIEVELEEPRPIHVDRPATLSRPGVASVLIG
jgi:low temperature requirement protein LtrA